MSSTTQPISAHSPRPNVGGNACLLALALLGVVACENDDRERSDASTSPVTMEAGADSDADDPAPDAESEDAESQDAEPDTAEPTEAGPGHETIGMACESDADCDDTVFCNGNERCVEDPNTGDKTCRPALRLACPPEHLPCDEVKRACNCQLADWDGDGDNARACKGHDCDDNDPLCHSAAGEVCDDQDRDEDCKPTTFGERDADKDGVVDQKCRNRDPDTGEWHHGDDCDDARFQTNPDALEVCDYVDNNCNGFVDEKRGEDGNYETEDGGQMNAFVPDWDGDGQGAVGVDEEYYCIYDAPRRFVLATNPQDCDDQSPEVRTGAPELCDGVDNDCDGLVDSEDELRQEYDFTSTTVRCADGAWIIPPGGCPEDQLWCPERGDPIEEGCRRSATRLNSCRACNTACEFACGKRGCDDLAMLALGDDHSCGVTGEGEAACWGRGQYGRLGNDAYLQSPIPVPVAGIHDVRSIAAGGRHTCAVVGAERSLFCWGDNRQWQLGDELEEEASPVPIPVPGVDVAPRLTGVVQVAAGEQHTCAVLENGRLVCFGATADGRLAIGETTQSRLRPVAARRLQIVPPVPIPVSVPVSDAGSVALGARHGCLLTRGGEVECWGSNDSGQLGRSTDTQAAWQLEKVPGLAGVSAIAAGDAHTCALVEGSVLCWGSNVRLQLGRSSDPAEDETWIAKPAGGLTDVTELAAGAAFNCAIRSNGETYCWGANSGGQLGPGFRGSSTNVPVLHPQRDLAGLRAGREHACALDRQSRAFCWGYTFYGQGGDGGTTETIIDPVQVHALSSALP